MSNIKMTTKIRYPKYTKSDMSPLNLLGGSSYIVSIDEKILLIKNRILELKEILLSEKFGQGIEFITRKTLNLNIEIYNALRNIREE